MELKARLESILWDRRKKEAKITFSSGTFPEELETLEGDLRVTVKKWRNKRSKNANAMFWACVGEIAEATGGDNEEIYLDLLRHYGTFTYIVVKKEALEAVKRQWREVEVVCESTLGGQPAVQVKAFFGSHTFDTKEFSRLLDGTISEMRNLGITPPPSEDMQRALAQWEAK